MTVRDMQASFTDTSQGAATSIVGAAGTYLAPCSLDTWPITGNFSEVTTNDTPLSNTANAARDYGGGSAALYLIINWIAAPAGGASVQMQLISSATPDMASPTVIYDFGTPLLTMLVRGYRQTIIMPRPGAGWQRWLGLQAITVGTMVAGSYAAWLSNELDTTQSAGFQGYAAGYKVF